MLSVGEMNWGLLDLANFLAKRAFTPIPGATADPFVAFPRGACGTTICAACDGLCIGWIGADMGESLGVEVEDIVRYFQ